MTVDMSTAAIRVQSLVEQPVVAVGAFAADLPSLAGAASAGYLARKACLPNRVLLAVTESDLHAVEPDLTWNARRLVASWQRIEVLAGRNGSSLVLTVPGFWVVRLAPLGPPARHVIDVLCA